MSFNDNENSKTNRLTYPVGIVVVTVWTISVIGGFITKDFTPLTITTPVMLILAGYAFGLTITKGGKNGK